MKGNLFIISSPSGGGKGTLIKRVLDSVSDVAYSVSYTTRERREGEVDGEDYNFVTREEFTDLIQRDEFLEYAEVHRNFYGTSRNQVEKEITSGRDIILEIDVQGADIVRRKLPQAVTIFILPPSYEVLEKRLTDRNTETDQALQIRLNNAKQEVRAFEGFDYIVVNQDVDKAFQDLGTIFLGERLRRDRQTDEIRDILRSFDVTIFD